MNMTISSLNDLHSNTTALIVTPWPAGDGGSTMNVTNPSLNVSHSSPHALSVTQEGREEDGPLKNITNLFLNNSHSNTTTVKSVQVHAEGDGLLKSMTNLFLNISHSNTTTLNGTQLEGETDALQTNMTNLFWNVSHSDTTVLTDTQIGTEDDDEILSRTSYTIMGVYLLLVGTLATIGNMVVVMTIGRNKTWRKKPQLLLIFNMALADLSISVFGYPLVMTSAFYGRWVFYDAGCQIYAFMTFFFSMGSMNSLVTLGLFRFIIICKPKYKSKLTISKVPLVIAAIWVYAFGATVPPLLGWSTYTYESFGVSCTMRWNGSGWDDISYIIFVCIFCYTGHLIVLGVCYGKISWRAHSLNCLTELNLTGMRNRKEIKASGMCFIMVLGFTVVWTPYAVISFADACYTGHIPIVVKTLPTMFAKSGPLMNPIIYIFLNNDFRKQIIQMLCKCCLRKVEPKNDRHKPKRYHGKRGEENNVFTVPYDKEDVYIGLCGKPVPICWSDLDSHLDAEEEDKEERIELSVIADFTLKGNTQGSTETTTFVTPYQSMDEGSITTVQVQVEVHHPKEQIQPEKLKQTDLFTAKAVATSPTFLNPLENEDTAGKSTPCKSGFHKGTVCRTQSRKHRQRNDKGSSHFKSLKDEISHLSPVKVTTFTDIDKITPVSTHTCKDLLCKDKLKCMSKWHNKHALKCSPTSRADLNARY